MWTVIRIRFHMRYQHHTTIIILSSSSSSSFRITLGQNNVNRSSTPPIMSAVCTNNSYINTVPPSSSNYIIRHLTYATSKSSWWSSLWFSHWMSGMSGMTMEIIYPHLIKDELGWVVASGWMKVLTSFVPCRQCYYHWWKLTSFSKYFLYTIWYPNNYHFDHVIIWYTLSSHSKVH